MSFLTFSYFDPHVASSMLFPALTPSWLFHSYFLPLFSCFILPFSHFSPYFICHFIDFYFLHFSHISLLPHVVLSMLFQALTFSWLVNFSHNRLFLPFFPSLIKYPTPLTLYSAVIFSFTFFLLFFISTYISSHRSSFSSYYFISSFFPFLDPPIPLTSAVIFFIFFTFLLFLTLFLTYVRRWFCLFLPLTLPLLLPYIFLIFLPWSSFSPNFCCQFFFTFFLLSFFPSHCSPHITVTFLFLFFLTLFTFFPYSCCHARTFLNFISLGFLFSLSLAPSRLPLALPFTLSSYFLFSITSSPLISHSVFFPLLSPFPLLLPVAP